MKLGYFFSSNLSGLLRIYELYFFFVLFSQNYMYIEWFCGNSNLKIVQCIFTVSLFVYSILAFFNANKCWQIFGRVKYITNTSNACKLKSVIGGVGVSCSGQGCGVLRQTLNTMKINITREILHQHFYRYVFRKNSPHYHLCDFFNSVSTR